jgi:hypothetical protein
MPGTVVSENRHIHIPDLVDRVWDAQVAALVLITQGIWRWGFYAIKDRGRG